MRTDNYNKTKIVNGANAVKAHRSPYHVDTIELKNDRYLIVEQCRSYEIGTPLQCAAFMKINIKIIKN